MLYVFLTLITGKALKTQISNYKHICTYPINKVDPSVANYVVIAEVARIY